MQSFFLQIDVAEIVIHKADQPSTFFDFFDPHRLPREDRAEINFFSVKTDPSAVGHVDGAVVKRIIQFRVGRDTGVWQAYKFPPGTSFPVPGAAAGG